MKLDRNERRRSAKLKEYLRQLSIGLVTGGTIGFAFSPMPFEAASFAILPLGTGIAAGVLGLIDSEEDK